MLILLGWALERHGAVKWVLAPLVIVALLLAGRMAVRVWGGEVSPWAWEGSTLLAARAGTAETVLELIMYLVFYVGVGFGLPYDVLYFAAWTKYINGRQGEHGIDRSFLLTGLAACSLGCLVAFLSSLTVQVALFDSLSRLPTGVSLLAAVASALLWVGGYGAVKTELEKTRVIVLREKYIVGQCPNCRALWTFPAEQLASRVAARPYGTLL